MAIDVSGDQEMLLKIARTSIRGKGTEMALDRLSQISVDAARAVVGFEGKDIEENIKMVHIPGGRIGGIIHKLRHCAGKGENISSDAEVN